MKRRAEHEVYELITSEWPNGRPRTGVLTFSHEHAQRWEADGGRVELLDHAAHMPAAQGDDVRRRDGTPELAADFARHKREHGAEPERLSKAQARDLLRSSPGPRETQEKLAEWFSLVGAAEDGEP